MVNYKLDAMLELRKYIWKRLKDTDIFNEDDYYSENIGDITVPIIPVQQVAELNQFLSGKKHIVYDKINLTYEDNWMICNEQILFTIYATDVADINEITNFINVTTLFECLLFLVGSAYFVAGSYPSNPHAHQQTHQLNNPICEPLFINERSDTMEI